MLLLIFLTQPLIDRNVKVRLGTKQLGSLKHLNARGDFYVLASIIPVNEGFSVALCTGSAPRSAANCTIA
ncbi:unnamed protein product [Chondrus crispus]|uniref:Uncharacterized protein n=1 Tax=Chondrus crispus TaxID=2769 RepID=R7QCJ2_CHOCR|nr:unnamed protein product [Chondrus crispus]CDF35141.1 unnamed protein product [Chondrus crispus]|eukprot:XP_005714960.1 unnamed protein product [Chondrus crispus]